MVSDTNVHAQGSRGRVRNTDGMKIAYNRDACQGHNRCYMLAPELFDVDDDGYAILLVDREILSELYEKAQLSVDNCPEYAIELGE